MIVKYYLESGLVVSLLNDSIDLEEKEMVSPLTPSDVDWDSLYEEAVEEEEVDMKSHGSVITHLLSQESKFNARSWIDPQPNIIMNLDSR